jgi:hypothetical protein
LIDTAEYLPTFERPALVVWASEDRVMPPEHGRRLTDLLPDARLVEIADSYTLLPLDQPVQFARAIREYMAETHADVPAPAAEGVNPSRMTVVELVRTVVPHAAEGPISPTRLPRHLQTDARSLRWRP